MKVKMEVECSPEEARAALGLPDVTGINEVMVAEMQARMKSNMAALAPEELLKTWFSLGGQAQEHFRKLMTAATSGSKL
jgi:hypothetical protein